MFMNDFTQLISMYPGESKVVIHFAISCALLILLFVGIIVQYCNEYHQAKNDDIIEHITEVI